jgi:hypothetical protein
MAITESTSRTQVLDRDWNLDGEALRELLAEAFPREDASLKELAGQDFEFPTMAHRAQAICLLANHCKTIVKSQPTLVNVPAPCKVLGDIHGQFRDMLILLARFGFPTHKGGDVETTSYIFNGDWIDRGQHQLEVVLLLMAIKVLYPNRVFLVRGNHEFRDTRFATVCLFRS